MLTDSPIRSEWNRSLTDSSVDSPAIPIDPPILRIMLKSAEAAPLSRPFVMPDVVSSRQRNHDERLAERANDEREIELRSGKIGIEMNIRKQLPPNRRMPTPIMMRVSMSCIIFGKSGMTRSCGRPNQMRTVPIWEALYPCDLPQV